MFCVSRKNKIAAMPQNENQHRNQPGGVRRPTFRKRLTLTATRLSVGVLVLTDLCVFFGAKQALRASTDSALLGVARSEVSSALYKSGGTALTLPAGSGYEKFVQVENAQDKIVAQTSNLMQGPALEQKPRQEARARSGQVVFADVALGQESLRCVYYPFQDAQGHSLLAIVGLPQQPVRRSLDLLALLLSMSLLVGAGAAAAGANRLSERLTQPLQDIAEAAQAIRESSLDRRIPSLSPDAEIQDVTLVLNEMLARLEAAFTAQQALVSSQSRFVADASHELRSPLSNLRGTVEVALRRPRSVDEYREALNTSLQEIERLSQIVTDLLTLSRADAGQFPIHAGFCDLSQIAGQAAAACAARAESAGVLLHFAADAPLPVLGDGGLLRQVADNLLDNALRYAPAQSRITVTAGQESAMACLTVQDVGEGLAEDEQARVFDRFYRADPSRARQSGGMGLGLAIAKAIAEAHHGQIRVQSRPGAGAAFTLCIPLSSETRD